jgi:hypothetical protein
VPKQLTDEQKWAWVELCLQFLQQYCEEGEAFLQWIVIGNEMWVDHYEPASNHQRMEWKHMSLPRTNKFRSVRSASKVMLMLFLDFKGPILEHYQDLLTYVFCIMKCSI